MSHSLRAEIEHLKSYAFLCEMKLKPERLDECFWIILAFFPTWAARNFTQMLYVTVDLQLWNELQNEPLQIKHNDQPFDA